MSPPRHLDGPVPQPDEAPTTASVDATGESLGPDAEALDRSLEQAIAAALRREMPEAAARRHLAAIAALSPERYPDPGTRPASIVPIERARRTGRRALVAAIAAALVLTLGSGSALAAAAEAKPGDALYGLKRASERIAVAMRRSPESKAALHLKFAQRRIDEIDALAAEGKDVSELAEDFAAELEAAGATASGDAFARIIERTRAHIEHLTQIRGDVPEEAQKGLDTAIENAERQQERTEERRREHEERERGRPDGPGNSGNAPGRTPGNPGR